MNETLILENKLKTAAVFETERENETTFELYAGFGERQKVAVYCTKEEAVANWEKDASEFLDNK